MKRGRNVCLIMKWVRNVFPKYDLWANSFLKYGLGAKRLSIIWFGGNVFPKYELRAKRLTSDYGAKNLCTVSTPL